MDQESFVNFFLNLPLPPQAIVLEKMKTHDIINHALFSPLFKDKMNSHCRPTKKVVIQLFNRRLDVSIEERHAVFGLRNILQLTPLATRTAEQQLEILKNLFKLQVTLKLNDFSNTRNHLERMFSFFEELNVVQINFGEFEVQHHRRFLERLRPSVMQLTILYNPLLPNFASIFGRPFDYLEFNKSYPLTVDDILLLNCKDTEIWITTLLEECMIKLLNRWMEGWNPLLKSFVAQFRLNFLQENYIDRVMETIQNTAASIHEDYPGVVPYSILWTFVHRTDRAFTIRGTLVDGGERTARIVFDTFGRVSRLKIIALN